MSEQATRPDELRQIILDDPDVILDDREVMQALISANGEPLGANIHDLRGIALARLESRLERLEDTHRSVIAAAYENLAGTNQIHRATLKVLDATDFPAFLAAIPRDIAEIMNVDAVRLVLETADEGQAAALRGRYDGILTIVGRHFIDDYLTGGRGHHGRPVTLRQIAPDDASIYGDSADWIRSEACLRLDLGAGRLPGLLALGSEDPHRFKPTQGTDLLAFFGGVFERAIRRWLT